MHSPDHGFGVYVHWPFCLAKCPYCDFNSHVRQAGVDQARFVAAFRREIAWMGGLAPGRTVSSIFFGGGTPSLMEPETVAAILDAIGGAWAVAPAARGHARSQPHQRRGRALQELPVRRRQPRLARRAGHERCRPQAARPNAQRRRGDGRRRHCRAAFPALLLRPDLRPAGPGAGGVAGRARGERSARAAEHLSLYQLTIEPDTVYERLVAAGKLVPMADDEARILFDITREVCEQAGPAGLRDLEPCPAGGRKPPQPRLLALWRVCRRRPGRPFAADRWRGNRRAIATERHPETWLATSRRPRTASSRMTSSRPRSRATNTS